VTIASLLLDWYATHGRDLPWRRDRGWYAVWISEVMLQQTRVETVRRYYERWIEKFPTVEALAAVELDKVLAFWEGLGYYRRAHFLHQAARILVAEHGGRLPRTVVELRRLPGIGRYTAAAIASIAFGADELALDGNHRRVLSRLFDLELDPRSSSGERRLLEQALPILPKGRAGEFNQALMDLGALLCIPRTPNCGACPLASMCLAHRRGVEAERPLRRPRRTVPHHTVVAAVLRRGQEVLIARRAAGRLLGGLWEFPGGKLEAGESLAECLRRELREELAADAVPGAQLGVFRHGYTHFTVTVHALECALQGAEPRALEHSQIRWTPILRLTRFPMGKVDRAIANTLIAEASHRIT